LLKGRDIVFVAGTSWQSNPTSQIQIPLRLARHNRVLFVNPAVSPFTPLKKIVKGVRVEMPPRRQKFGDIMVLTPMLLPFKDSKLGNRFSRYLRIQQIRSAMRELDFKEPVLIVGGARPETLGRLGEKLSVYHCNDDYSSGVEYMGTSRDWMLKRENETLSKVDLVIVTSQILLDKKNAAHNEVFFVPTGCDAAHFEKAASNSGNLPADIANIDRPLIGFMGFINNRIDFDLVYELSVARKDWSFVFIGSTMATVDKQKLERVRSRENVHMLGFKDKKVIPDYVMAFDVCLIPYVDNEFNRSSNPIKLYEYLATGKPIVSRRIPAVDSFKELVYLASDRDEFLQQIERALAESDGELQVERMKVARQNDWDVRARLYGDIILHFLEKK